MSAIRFENVFQSFGERVVFRDFNMEVQTGETKVVLGEGGSGKTTLLRMVLGLVQPDSGRVFVEDQEITGLSEPELMGIRKKIGIVFQEGALVDSLSVGENVAYRLREDAAYSAEEIEDSVIVGDDVLQAYIVHMDPVDGSSNIDVAVTIGSIFGIWRRTDNELVGDAMLLRRGREQVAAAYVVYGSSTDLVVATAGHVNGFTLDAESGEFALTHPSVKFPSKCEYYSSN